jgi:hypothetical protein
MTSDWPPSLAAIDSRFLPGKVANQIKTVPAMRMPRVRQSLESAVANDDVAGAAGPRAEGLLLRWAWAASLEPRGCRRGHGGGSGKQRCETFVFSARARPAAAHGMGHTVWRGTCRDFVMLLPLGPVAVAARSLGKLGWTERRAISLLGASMSPVMKTFLVYNACIAKKN